MQPGTITKSPRFCREGACPMPTTTPPERSSMAEPPGTGSTSCWTSSSAGSIPDACICRSRASTRRHWHDVDVEIKGPAVIPRERVGEGERGPREGEGLQGQQPTTFCRFAWTSTRGIVRQAGWWTRTITGGTRACRRQRRLSCDCSRRRRNRGRTCLATLRIARGRGTGWCRAGLSAARRKAPHWFDFRMR